MEADVSISIRCYCPDDVYSSLVRRWDEWVPLSRLLTYCEENIQKQKTLLQSAAASGALNSVKPHATQKGVSGVGTREGGAGTRGSRKDGTRGTKRGREEVILFLCVSDVLAQS